jgi:hypothetical protein
MTQYRVEWIIDVDADNPREAAEEAWDAMRQHDSTACSFSVWQGEPGGPYKTGPTVIDLLDTPDKRRMDQATTGVAAKDLKEGDLLDLYGDRYADPERDLSAGLEFEFAVVESVETDGPDRVLVYTDKQNFTCPADWTLYRAEGH